MFKGRPLVWKRPALAASLALLSAVMLMPDAALAAKGETACPPAVSGHERVDIDGWWDRTVDGFAAAGIDVYDPSGDYTSEFDAFAAAFGLVDGAGLEAFVRGPQWATIDRNGNGYGCMKSLPVTRGTPPYIFVGVDDNKPAS